MFKTLIAAAMISLLSVASHAADSNFTKQAINTVLQLNRNCSAVVVDTPDMKLTYLVTANHCVSDDATPDPDGKSGYLTIDVKDGAKLVSTEQFVYDVVNRDVKNDLAFIKLRKEGLFLDAAKLADSYPSEGDAVWTIGYSLGLPRNITQGFYLGLIAMKVSDGGGAFDEFGNADQTKMRASPAIVGGNSGGGMFAKVGDEYRLVGIADMVAGRYSEAGFYNPLDDVKALVKRGLAADLKVQEDKRSQK